VKSLYARWVKPRLPATVAGALSTLRTVVRGQAEHLRVHEGVTAVLGPQYRRSRTLLEIDLTYACNLKCYQCNRSVEQAPSTDHLRLEQIEAAIAEWVDRGKAWERIRLLGGEPTLHPQFAQVIERLRAWRDAHAPGCVVEVVTNGHGDAVAQRVAALPKDVVVDNSFKEGPEQPFTPFNVAPSDDPSMARVDPYNGCWVTEHCGVGLSPYGYYPCAVAGGIDRVFGMGLGRLTLPDDDDDMRGELEGFCALCGHLDRRHRGPAGPEVQSSRWRAAYARWHDEGDAPLPRFGGPSGSNPGD